MCSTKYDFNISDLLCPKPLIITGVTWGQHGDNMGTMWRQHGDHMGTTWGPQGCGDHMGIT